MIPVPQFSKIMAALVPWEPGMSLVSGGTSVLEGLPSSGHLVRDHHILENTDYTFIHCHVRFGLIREIPVSARQDLVLHDDLHHIIIRGLDLSTPELGNHALVQMRYLISCFGFHFLGNWWFRRRSAHDVDQRVFKTSARPSPTQILHRLPRSRQRGTHCEFLWRP